MDLLARREHGRVELMRKLRKRGAPEELIEAALQRLAEEGLLSEARYLESFVAYKARAVTGRSVSVKSWVNAGWRVAISIRLCVTVVSTGSSNCVKPGNASLLADCPSMPASGPSRAGFWRTGVIRWR